MAHQLMLLRSMDRRGALRTLWSHNGFLNVGCEHAACWALPNIGLTQKCRTRRRIVQIAKGKQITAHSLWTAWKIGANSLGGRRQPVCVWHRAGERNC